MADQHFWDNGIGERSTSVEYKLRYEDLNNQKTETKLMTLSDAAAQFEQLKSQRQTAWCELVHVTPTGDEIQQQFEFKVMDIGGVRIIL